MRELRLIAKHKPRYNKRSRFPERMHFLKLTREPWPRLSLVRQVMDDEADYLGPFSKKSHAERCLAALHDAFPVRQCTDRFGKQPKRAPCALGEMGRCLSPCDGSVDADTYAEMVHRLRLALVHDPDPVVEAISVRMQRYVAEERFEEASVHRDRLSSFLRAASRTQRLTALTRCAELIAARREDDGRWAVHVVRHGRLAAAGVIPREPTPTSSSTDSGPRPRPSCTVPAPSPPPRRRRPSRSCAGSSPTASVSSTSTASGPRLPAAPAATSPSTTPSKPPAAPSSTSTDPAGGRACRDRFVGRACRDPRPTPRRSSLSRPDRRSSLSRPFRWSSLYSVGRACRDPSPRPPRWSSLYSVGRACRDLVLTPRWWLSTG